jgi:hypothetical protein
MSTRKIAFIDETGDAHFGSGASKWFVLSAIVLEEGEEQSVRAEVEEIRRRNFQTGPIRSQYIADNHGRREGILKEFRGISFKTFVLIIDKSRLQAEWIKYTGSFYKFVHGLLQKDLFRIFPEIKVLVDRYGDKKYQESFAKYIEENHIPNLFDQAQIDVGSSKSDVLIQCADLFGGSLVKTIQDPSVLEKHPGIKDALMEKQLSVKTWPEDYKKYVLADILERYDEQDKLIANLSTNLAQVFIDENKGKQDSLVALRVKLLEFLLFNARFVDESEYITTSELLSYLNRFNVYEISEENFRSDIIGKIRDDQVIIASSRKGLKLPTRYSEILDYLNTQSQQVFPMLARMKTARETIMQHSLGKLDIVDYPGFKYLKDIFESGII